MQSSFGSQSRREVKKLNNHMDNLDGHLYHVLSRIMVVQRLPQVIEVLGLSAFVMNTLLSLSLTNLDARMWRHRSVLHSFNASAED